MDRLVLASNNRNKLREIRELLTLHGLGDITVEPVGTYTTEEPVEDGGSYLANATIKARAAAAISGLPSLAEDSGIEIAALNGAPGVETAPWVASMGGWEAAMAHVNDLVQTGASDGIDFRSTFVLSWSDGKTLTASAVCPGNFVWPARGAEGFGHDPYFVPAPVEGYNFFIPYTESSKSGLTYAEMGLAEKQKISPRALALAKLTDLLKTDDARRTKTGSDNRRTEGYA